MECRAVCRTRTRCFLRQMAGSCRCSQPAAVRLTGWSHKYRTLLKMALNDTPSIAPTAPHCHKWIHQFMQSDDGGSLRRFFDLPMLMDARPEWLEADDRAAQTLALTDDDEEEEDETQKPRWQAT